MTDSPNNSNPLASHGPDGQASCASSDDRAWQLLLGLRRLSTAGTLGQFPVRVALTRSGPAAVAADRDWDLLVEQDGSWETSGGLSPEEAALVDLYLPVCLAGPEAPLTVAHLGQSLDGQIATRDGQSHYVTGPENIRHLHRMRALSDAVIVGAATVAFDDPQLTTRLVPGPSPQRVVIDPDRRLPADRRLFREPAAPTLLICRTGSADFWRESSDHLEVLELPDEDGGIDPAAIVAALRARGCSLLFVEGGGRTVSRFVEAQAVDRLQIAVAPLIMGAGRPGLALAGQKTLDQALRPTCRAVPMGQDVLFDCELGGRASKS